MAILSGATTPQLAPFIALQAQDVADDEERIFTLSPFTIQEVEAIMWVRIQLVNGQSQKPASDHYYWPPELGTDGFGLGETRDDLRNYFEISADYIIQAALAEMY